MVINFIKYFACFAFVLMTVAVNAQGIENSPYSKFGIGDQVDKSFSSSRNMGSLRSVYTDPYSANLYNPATLPYIYASSFELGGYAKYAIQKDNTKDDAIFGGNLDYLSIAFPLSNPINDAYEGKSKAEKWGMNISLVRNSNVGYNISSLEQIEDLGTVQRSYSGTGGTYNFLVGTGYRYKDFSVGLNLGYLFGNLKYSRTINFVDLSFPYNNDFNENYFLRGFTMRGGLMYNLTLNKTQIKANKNADVKRLTIGVSGTPATKFSTLKDRFELVSQNLGTRTNIDTVNLQRDIEGSGKLPAEFNFGLFFSNGEKFGAGIDVGIGSWSNYYNEANYENINSLNNTTSVSFGGFFRPDYKSYTSFWKRVQYQYGVYYRQDPRVINDTQIENYGVTFGLGLPVVFQRKFSNANLGFDIGKLGSNTPISETYIRLNFGFSFNDDEWFIKRKYN